MKKKEQGRKKVGEEHLRQAKKQQLFCVSRSSLSILTTKKKLLIAFQSQCP